MEIKFRAWFKGHHPAEEEWDKPTMIYGVERLYDGSVKGLGAYGSFGSLLDNDDFVVMQFTGLKDRSGKEIYEGDLIFGPGSKLPQSVIWSEERGGWSRVGISDGSAQTKRWDNFKRGLAKDYASMAEVVGNNYVPRSVTI